MRFSIALFSIALFGKGIFGKALFDIALFGIALFSIVIFNTVLFNIDIFGMTEIHNEELNLTKGEDFQAIGEKPRFEACRLGCSDSDVSKTALVRPKNSLRVRCF